jgi:hypothetical protein
MGSRVKVLVASTTSAGYINPMFKLGRLLIKAVITSSGYRQRCVIELKGLCAEFDANFDQPSSPWLASSVPHSSLQRITRFLPPPFRMLIGCGADGEEELHIGAAEAPLSLSDKVCGATNDCRACQRHLTGMP